MAAAHFPADCFGAANLGGDGIASAKRLKGRKNQMRGIKLSVKVESLAGFSLSPSDHRSAKLKKGARVHSLELREEASTIFNG